MSLSLQEIIQEMKTAATNAGFVKVEEFKVNNNDVADTEVPAMHIKMTNIEYGDADGQFLATTNLETYSFELLIVTNNATDPISSLKTLQDNFLIQFLNAAAICDYVNKRKINLINSPISNDQILYSQVGGESTILNLTIENINSFDL
jgi:hypothetical protein